MQQSYDNLKCNSPMWCTSYTQDVNAQAGQLKGWQQEYNQLSDGTFQGAMIHTDLGHFRLFQEHTSQALQQFCRVPEGAIWIGFSATPQRVCINHQQTNANTLMVRPGGIDFELSTDINSTLFGVVIASDTLKGQSERLLGHFAETLDTPQINALRNYMATVFKAQRLRWQSKTHQQLLHDYFNSLLSSSEKNAQLTKNRNQAISAVRTYLSEANDEATITVAGLATVAGLSPRDLHRLFYDHYGVSPARFLQSRRLNKVRRELQNNFNKRCVADIAFENGFFHLSQFSKQYCRLFGELPSKTKLTDV